MFQTLQVLRSHCVFDLYFLEDLSEDRGLLEDLAIVEQKFLHL